MAEEPRDGGEPRRGGERRDYYDPNWGRYVVEHQGIDAGGEVWERQLPLMRGYSVVVLGTAAILGFPRDGAALWQPALAAAGLTALAVAFWVMWFRRPIWAYPIRVLAIHGVFQLVTYSILVALSPRFAILALIAYPQIAFSLPTRWSVLGVLAIGAVTGIAFTAHDPAGLSSGPSWLVANLLIAGLVIAMGVWMRLTIAQSMERRALINELTTTRRELARAERETAIAEERARLAREIHDTLAQGFASVVAHLEAADASLGANDERVRDGLRAAQGVARSSLAEARTMVWALRPETLAAAGLPAAIERVAAAAGGRTVPSSPASPNGSASDSTPSPHVEVTVSGLPRTLHPEVEVTLLRAAQEALANAVRHSGASMVTVTLTYFGDEVSLDVVDDGRGFDPTAAGPGLGLRGMRERAEALGGRVEIESVPEEGTTIAVTLPAIDPPGGEAAGGATPVGELATPTAPETGGVA